MSRCPCHGLSTFVYRLGTATELKGQAVLADDDAIVENDLAKKYNIQGFLKLKVFGDGQELTE